MKKVILLLLLLVCCAAYAAAPDTTIVYDGKVIGFCCSDCPPEFNKDPEKYMKDLK